MWKKIHKWLTYRAPMDEDGNYVSEKHPEEAAFLNRVAKISNFVAGLTPLRWTKLYYRKKNKK